MLKDWEKEFLRYAPGPWLIMMWKYSNLDLGPQEKIIKALRSFDDLPLQDQHNAEALGRAYAQKYKVLDYQEHNRLNENWLPEWCVFKDENNFTDWSDLIRVFL